MAISPPNEPIRSMLHIEPNGDGYECTQKNVDVVGEGPTHLDAVIDYAQRVKQNHDFGSEQVA